MLSTDVFDAWLDGLRDVIGKKRVQARMRRAELGNFGDCDTVGAGVNEVRIHYGPGYLVYFTQQGMEVIILLAGGDKSSQPRDIKRAKEIARKLQGELQ